MREQRRGSTPTSTMASLVQEASQQLLDDALARVLEQLRTAPAVRKFVQANCSWFADFYPGCEHMLEWTDIHSDYCTLAEGCISTELAVSGCSEDMLLDHAARVDQGSDWLLARLLAITDYDHFCALMQAESQAPGIAGDADSADEANEDGVDAEASDDGDDGDDGDLVSEGEEASEGLEEMEQAMANARVAHIERLERALERKLASSHVA